VLTAQRRMCTTVGGALSETVATVSLRTKRMLMFRLRKKNVPRPDRTDVVPGWNSTRNCSGSISNVGLPKTNTIQLSTGYEGTKSSAITEGPRDALCY